MAQRVSQDPVIVLGEGSPKARASQDPVLVLGEGSPAARVSQLVILVLIDAAINPATVLPNIFAST